MSKEYWMGEYVAERTITAMKSKTALVGEGESILPNTAVSLIDGKIYNPKMINYSLLTTGYGAAFSSLKLDATRIFFVHGRYARVLTVTDGVITTIGDISSALGTLSGLDDIYAVLIDTDKVLLVTIGTGTTGGEVLVASINGSTISFGTPLAYETASSVNAKGVALTKLSTNTALFGWNDSTNDDVSVAVITVSGTTVTKGTTVNLEASAYTNMMALTTLTTTTALISYEVSGTNAVKATVLSVSGTTITPGTPLTLGMTNPNSDPGICLVDTNKVLLVWNDVAVLLTISGTTVTEADVTGFNFQGSASTAIIYISQNKFAIVRSRKTVDTGINDAYVNIGTISGTTVTFNNDDYLFYPVGSINTLKGFLFDTDIISIYTYKIGVNYTIRNLKFSGTTILTKTTTEIDGFSKTTNLCINGANMVVWESLE